MAKELVIQGDCLNVLKTFEDNSVDAVVTDPPYGLSKEPDINEVLTKWLAGEPYDHNHGGFMGKEWDSFVPHPDIWREVFRVLKPGGHALVFAGTRTQDLMTISLRLAGFEVRDVIEFLYMTGFPKGHNVSKTFESRGNSELAERYKGFNTNLKPAHEPIIMVRKPLHDGRKMTVVDCVEKYGTGAINIDACRIGNEKRENAQKDFSTIHGNQYGNGAYQPTIGHKMVAGRFPANCITLDSDEFYSKYFNISPPELSKKASKKDRNSDWQGEEIFKEVITWENVNLTEELEELNRLRKVISEDITQGTGKHVWSTLLFGKNITAEKFLKAIKYTTSTELNTTIGLKTCDLLTLLLTNEYTPDVIRTIMANGLNLAENAENINRLKQSITNEKMEYRLGVASAVLETLLKIKEKGKLGNVHSTVKPTDLMAWLVRLVTPEGGTVLDPFAGSGSTLVAAKREGFGFIGIEREPEYVEIIEARTHTKAIKCEGEAN